MAEVLDLSGLEFMQAYLEGRICSPAISRTMGCDLYAVAPDRVAFRGAPTFDTTNPMGHVHGGWYGAFLDSAMACAIMTRVPKGSVYTTLEYKVSIIRPIPLGMMIEGEGVVEHAGRSTGVARGTLRGVEDGKLYATGTTTCIIMKMD